jgi:hypothetical protein
MNYGIYPSSFSRLQIHEANLGACHSLDGASRLEHIYLETYTLCLTMADDDHHIHQTPGEELWEALMLGSWVKINHPQNFRWGGVFKKATMWVKGLSGEWGFMISEESDLTFTNQSSREAWIRNFLTHYWSLEESIHWCNMNPWKCMCHFREVKASEEDSDLGISISGLNSDIWSLDRSSHQS